MLQICFLWKIKEKDTLKAWYIILLLLYSQSGDTNGSKMKKIQVESNTIFFRVFKFNLSHFESGKEKLFQLEIQLLYLSVKLRLQSKF